ncbi:MAG TPA: hypothetical protein VLJ84_07940 [Usitatibacter sp.]|nr:hypothetical protein [Usitatibacter sp.]
MDRILAAAAAAALAAGLALPAAAQDVERGVSRHVEALRAMQPDPARSDEYNREMDDAWKDFDAHPAKSLPILRSTLIAETKKAEPSAMVLLDIGYYLYTHGSAIDKDAALAALFAVDTRAPIVRHNQQQLFYFTLSVANDRVPRVLDFIDRAFLESDVQVVIPPNGLTLDAVLTSVFLYGVYGEGAESHLWPVLKDPKWERRALEVLIWIGTPASNNAVRDAIYQYRDYETFARATAFLMQDGGPAGRDIMLAIDPQQLDPQAAQFYAVSRPRVESANYAWYKGLFERSPGPEKIPDAELRKQLASMPAHARPDQPLAPKAIFASTLPREDLVRMLLAARHAMFERVSDEALGDVKTTNMLLNGLRYR